MSAIQREYADRGFRLVAISSNDAERYPADSFEAMKQHASEQGFLFDYLYDADQSVARAYGPERTPEVFLDSGAPARLPRRDRRLAGRGRGVRALPPATRSRRRSRVASRRRASRLRWGARSSGRGNERAAPGRGVDIGDRLGKRPMVPARVRPCIASPRTQ